ncbi:hypothetical protein [Halocatena marina]|uniref:hypothetical protein n=1 Tax=Halocatena marina TaxID=2934937 RepID=UPI00200D97B9|nr:hypothetical protein [Halocatena marina]
MTDAQFEWMLGMAAAYRPTPEDEADDPDPVTGLIEEVRDDSPTPSEQHVRVVLETDDGLVDIGHDRVEVV